MTKARSARLSRTPPWTAPDSESELRWRWRMGIRTRAQPSEPGSSIQAKVFRVLEGSEACAAWSGCCVIVGQSIRRMGTSPMVGAAATHSSASLQEQVAAQAFGDEPALVAPDLDVADVEASAPVDQAALGDEIAFCGGGDEVDL